MIFVFHLWIAIFIFTSIPAMFLMGYLSMRKNLNKQKNSITYDNNMYDIIASLSFTSNGIFIPVTFILIIISIFQWPIFNIIMLLTYFCFGIIVAVIRREYLIEIVDNSVKQNDDFYVWFYILLIIITILNPLFFIIDKIFKQLIINNVFYKTYKNKQEKKG